MDADGLRSGDVVEVRSPREILATLDDRGMLDGLPFMPEMMRFCERRFTVDRRAEKICDTIYPLASRRLPDTVLLEDLRCDGSAHDGCQAECRLFWKDAWLRRVSPNDAPAKTDTNDEARVELANLASQNSKDIIQIDGQQMPGYTCQATQLHDASQYLRPFDPRPYVREYTTGNVGFRRFLSVSARAAIVEPFRRLGLTGGLPLRSKRKGTPAAPELGLQPGDLVEVKSRDEIAATLNEHGRNRGLSFDTEMLPYCGGIFRVRQRIQRFIDDRTRQMVQLKSDCVTLEGVVCSGERSVVRWFCPRAIYPYWRDAWLRRVNTAVSRDPADPETTVASLEK
jgi:hypothetical protein